MSNTEIWDALARTDPTATKPFSRAGGFKGTAVKPMWIIKRLTEQFGAAGVGWGVNRPEFQVVPCEGETLVYCTVSAWHGARENLLWGVGGDKVQAKRSSGPFCDDEAFKKAFTDAINNAFKSIGVAADIHMGRFDDDKYVEQISAEFEAERVASQPLPAEVSAMLDAIRACATEADLLVWKSANGKAANATGHGALISGEWSNRKEGLAQVAAYASG